MLIKNIACLAGIQSADKRRLMGTEMSHLNSIQNAWLHIQGEHIVDFGNSDTDPMPADTDVVDAQGGTVLPGFCDPHTHIVYAGSREQEFVDKIQGLSYAEIARRGGGILNSADQLHQMTEDELFTTAMERINEVTKKGTVAIEIKSGYGLNTDDELKMLRVIRRIRQSTRLEVRSTFLGAHAVGRAFAGRQADYVDYLINDTLPAVAAGRCYGMRGKLHVEELAASGGLRVAVSHNALSADHLESMNPADTALLVNSETMPTALPGTSFFLNMRCTPARHIIDSGLGIALASDYNPGSTPSGDMKFIVSLACIKLRLMPCEALNAATLNAAYAMGVDDRLGSITRGKLASFIITRPIPSIEYIPYAYTTPLIDRVFLRGTEV